MRTRHVAPLLAAFVLAGCTADSQPGATPSSATTRPESPGRRIETAGDGSTSPLGSFSGTLGSRGGCVVLVSREGTPQDLLFAEGWTVTSDGTILGGDGRARARVGDRVTGPGGAGAAAGCSGTGTVLRVGELRVADE